MASNTYPNRCALISRPPFSSRQRGFTLLELSLILGVAVAIFVIAAAVREGWELLELKAFDAPRIQEEMERRVPIVVEAVRAWYLHEYCGQGAVDRHKRMLPPEGRLTCGELPLRPGLDDDSEYGDGTFRNLRGYLNESGILDDEDHGYSWSVSRPAQDPTRVTRILLCDPTAISNRGTCRLEEVVRGVPAQVGVVWGPAPLMFMDDATEVEREEQRAERARELFDLAQEVGGIFALAETPSYARFRQLLCAAESELCAPGGTLSSPGAEDCLKQVVARAGSHSCLQTYPQFGRYAGCIASDGTCPETEASIGCALDARRRDRVIFPTAVVTASSAQRGPLRGQWRQLWCSSSCGDRSRYDADSDGDVDDADYVRWGC